MNEKITLNESQLRSVIESCVRQALNEAMENEGGREWLGKKFNSLKNTINNIKTGMQGNKYSNLNTSSYMGNFYNNADYSRALKSRSNDLLDYESGVEKIDAKNGVETYDMLIRNYTSLYRKVLKLIRQATVANGGTVKTRQFKGRKTTGVKPELAYADKSQSYGTGGLFTDKSRERNKDLEKSNIDFRNTARLEEGDMNEAVRNIPGTVVNLAKRGVGALKNIMSGIDYNNMLNRINEIGNSLKTQSYTDLNGILGELQNFKVTIYNTIKTLQSKRMEVMVNKDIKIVPGASGNAKPVTQPTTSTGGGSKIPV